MNRNLSRCCTLTVIAVCLLTVTSAHAQQAQRHRGQSRPRSGFPTGPQFSLGDSVMQTISWLNPVGSHHPAQQVHHSRFGRRHAVRGGHAHAHPANHSHGHAHGQNEFIHEHEAEHLDSVAPEELEVRLDVVEQVSHSQDGVIAQPGAAHQGIVHQGAIQGGHIAGCDSCHPGGACDTCCLIPFPTFNWDNLELGFGVQGFTGPTNRGQTGSFGINASLNYGVAFPFLTFREMGGQFGFRTVKSNFSGAEFTSAERNQFFLTTGVFHRVDWGFQGGLVIDYLRDDWYMQADLTQVRGEISWVFPCTHEWGFWFAAKGREDIAVSTVGQVGNMQTFSETFSPTDVYAFFYRYRADDIGGEARGFAGWTGQSDGLIGADFRIPLAPRWDIDCAFTYLVPEESSSLRGHEQESWNLSMNMIWYPGCRTTCDSGYYRPLFDVADNGSFFVDR